MNKRKRALLPLNILSDLHIYAWWLGKRITDYCFSTTKKMIKFVCNGVFNVCERLGKDQKLSVEQRHSVMKYICNIIRFSTLSVFLWDKRPPLPPNRKRWLAECWTRPGFLFTVIKVSLRAEAATRPRWTVLGWGGDRRGAQGEKWSNTI